MKSERTYAAAIAAIVLAALVAAGCRKDDDDDDGTVVVEEDDGNDSPKSPPPSQPPPNQPPPDPGGGGGGGGGTTENLVVRWNEKALQIFVADDERRPTVAARTMFLLHTAMWDAYALFHPTFDPVVMDVALRRPTDAQTQSNRNAAAIYAAWRFLRTEFPAHLGEIDTLLSEHGMSPSDSADLATPAGIGNSAAAEVRSARETDGSNSAGGYAEVTSSKYPALYAPYAVDDPDSPNWIDTHSGFNHDRWMAMAVPTGTLMDADGDPSVNYGDPATFNIQTFVTPHWGNVTPFALAVSSEFRPPKPPDHESFAPYTTTQGVATTETEAWHDQHSDVSFLNRTLTPTGKVVAELFNAGPGRGTIVVLLNRLSYGISVRDAHTIEDDMRFYFALSAALFDVSIAAWEGKRHYDFVNAIAAIRHEGYGFMVEGWGGPNDGNQTFDGRFWKPYQDGLYLSSPWPEWPATPTSFTSAWAHIVEEFTGGEAFHAPGVMVPDVNGDGSEDELGVFSVSSGWSTIETGPTETVTITWATVVEVADDAQDSVLLGGLTIRDAAAWARPMGHNVGGKVWTKVLTYFNGSAVP